MIRAALALALALSFALPVSAQTIGYAEAIDRLAVACGKDIDRFCKTVNLGGNRITQCLSSQTGVSAGCRATAAEVRTLLDRRAQARAAVTRVCDADIRRLCGGVQAGDGNLLECFFKARRNVSAPCQRAVADAGWE